RKRIWLLKYHADPRHEFDDIERRGEDVLAIDADRAGGPATLDRVVHADEAAEEGRLAAAGRADQCGYRAFGQADGNVEQSLLVAVEHGNIAGDDARRGGGHAGPGAFQGRDFVHRIVLLSRRLRSQMAAALRSII